MTLVQRLGTAMLLVGVTGIGLSPAAEAHRDHHHHNRHSHKKQKAYDKGYMRGYRNAIDNTRRRHVHPIYRRYSPVYGPMGLPAPWMVPVHLYHQGNLVSGGSGSICRQQINPPCLIESAKKQAKPGATMC